MFRKILLVALLGLVPSIAMAQPEAGNWELTLTGQGSNDNDFDSGDFGINVSLGHFLTKELEVAVRQGVSYSDGFDDGEDNLNGSTVIALDYHFDLGQWQPFVGILGGGVYGDGTNDTFLAGAEAGVKYFVNKTTFIFGTARYEFFFDDGDEFDDAADDGRFVYGLGIGFLF
jgi:hypothetical protein